MDPDMDEGVLVAGVEPPHLGALVAEKEEDPDMNTEHEAEC